ncbi:hypothetical protein T11_6124 [Trichinella zimbabwensis]|uniref:Uncharacterized protein n=1 Tax=Trichinella zimbabwensis TaxID=268475 RepID=A0A0V1HGQ9_9BILA|nr:hypothetical protein T11_6124 [Trichinella zimbabwensis]
MHAEETQNHVPSLVRSAQVSNSLHNGFIPTSVLIIAMKFFIQYNVQLSFIYLFVFADVFANNNNSLTTALGNLLIFGAPLQQILAKIRNFYDLSPHSFLIINMSAIRRHLEEQESCSSVERRALSRGGLG